MAMERTFLMVKPDGVQRGLIGEIMTRFEKKGWKLIAAKFVCAKTELLEEVQRFAPEAVANKAVCMNWMAKTCCCSSRVPASSVHCMSTPAKVLSTDTLSQHYAEHKGKPFLPGLISFMSSGPVFAMVWEGADIIAQARRVMGATNPNNADIGTIRADYCVVMGRNVIHGSDSSESAKREINLWFDESELISWNACTHAWNYEN
eukprot:Gregarina_sp_Pseudo_9__1826@NODE_2244_length_1078_cov_422_673725_g2066_i0_p2_GENE_NODE_2244_length_1078_cov_422_673725_g2066_i0NODE_2244_length_1078_cov_422_673725_g2066_i0_p2_ORF_typecomplete_len204_score56_05NDK/PF00334_19/2e11NDK/PF00334_19/1_8e36_NODE_2244_length_1078_cov_422_673725_g2066_i095706